MFIFFKEFNETEIDYHSFNNNIYHVHTNLQLGIGIIISLCVCLFVLYKIIITDLKMTGLLYTR